MQLPTELEQRRIFYTYKNLEGRQQQFAMTDFKPKLHVPPVDKTLSLSNGDTIQNRQIDKGIKGQNYMVQRDRHKSMMNEIFSTTLLGDIAERQETGLEQLPSTFRGKSTPRQVSPRGQINHFKVPDKQFRVSSLETSKKVKKQKGQQRINITKLDSLSNQINKRKETREKLSHLIKSNHESQERMNQSRQKFLDKFDVSSRIRQKMRQIIQQRDLEVQQAYEITGNIRLTKQIIRDANSNHKGKIVLESLQQISQRDKQNFDSVMTSLINLSVDDQQSAQKWEIQKLKQLYENTSSKDEQLRQRFGQYWTFDSKGRNIEELKNRILVKRYKRRRHLFSEEVKGSIEKLKFWMVCIYRRMKLMKITPYDVIENKAILLKPYQRDGSYSFFKCVKKNEIELFEIFIQRCRFYVLDINHHHKTCLHIACEKGYIILVRKILELGCEIDKGDLLDRSPLHYAIQYDLQCQAQQNSVIKSQESEKFLSSSDLTLTKLLLKNKANPFMLEDVQTQNQQLIDLLLYCRQAYMQHNIITKNQRQKFWGKVVDEIENF